MMTMMVLYAGSMMTSLMAALISCDTLSGEIASGTIHAIATKPVNRWCLVLGKWIGFTAMLTLYVLFIEGGTIAIARIEGHRITPHTAACAQPDLAAGYRSAGRDHALQHATFRRSPAVLLSGALWPCFCGRMDRTVWRYPQHQACVDLGILSSLIMPSDALWRKVAFKVQPPILGAAGVSPFSSSAVPSTAMVVFAVVYAVLAVMLAQIVFERRDL